MLIKLLMLLIFVLLASLIIQTYTYTNNPLIVNQTINNTVNHTIYVNNTIYSVKEVKIIEKVSVEVPAVCPPPKIDNRLTMCNIRLDDTNRYLGECLRNNNTVFADNLTNELKQCNAVKQDYIHRINNISSLATWIK